MCFSVSKKARFKNISAFLLYVFIILIRINSSCLYLNGDRSKFYSIFFLFISSDSLLNAGCNHVRTNFPKLIRNYDFMIQISMSVKLPYKKNNTAVAR